MRIPNAADPLGIFSIADQRPNLDEWQEGMHQNCPTGADRHLFRFLEEAYWCGGHICAAARWHTRIEDEPEKGPTFVKGSIAIHGSGIQFYWLDQRAALESDAHFICEVPWQELFDGNGTNRTFLGGDALLGAFMERVNELTVSAILRKERLQHELRDASRAADRLTHALNPLSPL